MRTPLQFEPGSKYQYSSMAILLATRVAELISATDILTLVDRAVFQPLGMQRSVQGLGRFKLEDMVSCQTEFAAPEAGGGDPKGRSGLDSAYWATCAPWAHPRLGARCRKIPCRIPE